VNIIDYDWLGHCSYTATS